MTTTDDHELRRKVIRTLLTQRMRTDPSPASVRTAAPLGVRLNGKGKHERSA